MARYAYTIPGGRGRLSREYTSIVAARKAGLNAIHANYAYGQTVTIIEIVGDRQYHIGELDCSRYGLAFYKSNRMGKPRPNNIKEGTWFLNKDGTLGRRLRSWSIP